MVVPIGVFSRQHVGQSIIYIIPETNMNDISVDSKAMATLKKGLHLTFSRDCEQAS